jgi:polyisoprenoid-binding protein YceI
MPITPGTHTFGPDNATLLVRTRRTGAAAKAGHNLLIQVTAWQATLFIGDDPAQNSVVLDADATSLRVREGTGGMQELGDDEMVNIEQTINDEILNRQSIEFRSTAVQISADGTQISVQGELTMVGTTSPIGLELTVGDDGRLSGSAVVKQTDWGITPYSTLFGTLKVVDEVEVVIDSAHGQGAAPAVPYSSEPGSNVPAPIVDPRFSSFLWALLCFLLLWFDMVAVGVSHSTSVIFALVASSFVYIFIRTSGSNRNR